MMKTLLSIGMTAVLAGVALPAAAQTPPPPPPAKAKTIAMPYVMASGMSDLYEINSSQIALQKTRSPAVRSFANMMIKHHTKTTADTMAAARKAGLNSMAPTPDAGVQASLAELQAADATSFDRLYLGQQVPAHQAALDLHRSYAKSGDQAALKANGAKAVPIVQSHLMAAQRLMRGAGMAGQSGM